MVRLHRHIFRLNDQIASIRGDEDRAAAELMVLIHLDDDARRDAAVGGPADRSDARETSGDVDRMRRHVGDLQLRRAKLETKRDRLLRKLDRRT